MEGLVLVVENIPGEDELLGETNRKLAELDSHIPLWKCLHEAATIYSDVLRSMKDRFMGPPKHPLIARAEPDFVADVDAVAGPERRFVEKELDPTKGAVRFLEDDEASADTPWPPEWEDEKPPTPPP
ncbi:hypothetical protein GGTG_04472 [Gaeumannomyces tritici R3-111a-1]|uniref:Uncharacterized protein n=1 Tax=Gaeumannomyces tritici (strain R3-111a-1) TaxID=644352 RepID=J3NT73_GAET3|nr:hypothetical protein GGTG_04472 [Gaeumannomyces tritici R3-111a-1]EJT79388.1 hypothetical protein GGTG_04472 [Gaeumannomyces tritici R3-111a-1]